MFNFKSKEKITKLTLKDSWYMLQKDLRCCGSGNSGNYHGYDCEILKIQTNIIVHVLTCYIPSLVAGG